MKITGISSGKRRCFLTLLGLFVMLACPGRTLAAPPIFRHGQVKASDLELLSSLGNMAPQ